MHTEMTLYVTHQPCILNMSVYVGGEMPLLSGAEAEILAGTDASLHNLHCLILVGGVFVLFF